MTRFERQLYIFNRGDIVRFTKIPCRLKSGNPSRNEAYETKEKLKRIEKGYSGIVYDISHWNIDGKPIIGVGAIENHKGERIMSGPYYVSPFCLEKVL